MEPVLQLTAEYLRRHQLGEVVSDRAFLPESCPLALRTDGALAWFRATAEDRIEADWRTAQTEIAALPLDRMPFRRLYLTLLVEDCDRPRPDWGRIARDLHVCRKLVVSAAGHPVAKWLGELPFLPIPDDMARPRLISTPAHALHEAGFAPELADGLLGNTPAARLAQLFAAGEGLLGTGAPAPAELFLSARDSYRRLVKLEVDNFRPFGHALSLPLDGDLTIIFGPNGSGKSSLAQALEWGVIGEVATLEQPHDDARAAGGAPPYINVCHPHRPATVKLTLRDETDGAEHALERRIDPTGGRTAVWQGNRATGAGEALTALLDARLPVMPHIATLKAMARQSHFLDQETIRNFLSDTAADRYKALANMVGTVDFERASQKLAQVLKTLDGERVGAEGRQKTLLAQLDVESRSLEAQRAELERAGRSVTEALDLTQTAADLHRTALALGVPVRPEPPSPDDNDLTAFAQALHAGVTAEQARLVRRREQLAAALAEQKRAGLASDEAERLLAELNELEPALTERRLDLQRRQAQAEAVQHKLDSAAAACRHAEREVRAARSRSDAVEALAEAGRAWVQLAGAEAAAGEELKAAEAARVEARGHADSAQACCAELEAQQDRLRSRRAALTELRAGQPLLAEAQATLVRSAADRTRLLGELAQLQAERQELLRQAGEAESLAAGHEAGLKRLQVQSRERHRLLASMAGYLDGARCPLCGHDWQTAEALLQEVQSALRETPAELVLAEQALAREAQRLSEARAALARVESRLAGLGTELDETDRQARQARDRLDRWLNLARGLAGDPGELSAGQSVQLLARWEQDLAAADRTVDLEAARLALGVALGEFARAEARLAAARQTAQAGSGAREEVRMRYQRADQAAPANVNRPVPPESQVEAAAGEAAAAAERLGEATQDLDAARVKAQEVEGAEREARRAYEAARGRKSLLEEQLRTAQATVGAYAGTLAALGLATSPDDSPAAELCETNRRIGRLEQAAERACWLTEAARVTTLREAVARAEAQEAEARTRLESAAEEANRWAKAAAEANRATAALGTARTREQDQRLTCYEPAVNEIYRRINPHPYFPRIRLEPAAQTSQLTIHATTADNQGRLPVQQYFSMAQANVVALSIFLGTALLQTWSGLRLICIDDPIQQMDDLNTVAFLDVLHAIVQRRRQVVVTTANKEFYQLMLRRYAYLNQHQTRFRAFRLRTVNLETGPDIAEDSPRFLSDTLVRLGPN